MKTRLSIASLVLILLAIGVSLWAYPHMPDRIASHWNAAGEANGTMSRGWGVAFVPILMIGMWGLFRIIMRMDPMQKNIQEMRWQINMLIVSILAFFLYVHGMMIAWNLGYHYNFGRVLIPAIAALFFGIGTLIRDAKPNWFFGIRTPWTLSSDVVWAKTHRTGAMLYQGAGIISLVGVLFPTAGIYILIGAILIASLGSIVASYVYWRQAQKNAG